MIGALAFAALLVAFYVFSFGLTRPLLRTTTWEPYSFDAPWLTGPALVVLCLSLLGYHEPFEQPTWQPCLLFATGTLLSVVVAVWDRTALAELLRACWKRSLLVALPAGLSCG